MAKFHNYEIYDYYYNMIFRLELEPWLVEYAQKGSKNSQNKIAMMCRKQIPKSRARNMFIRFENLEFTDLTNVEKPKPVQNSFAHRTDGLSACDNPNCKDCDNGYYDRCRFR